MTLKKHHPGKLIATWCDLPVSGVCMETGKVIKFPYGNIIWEQENIVDGGTPVFIGQKYFIVRSDSMFLIFPDSSDDFTPIQKLAISAIQLSHREYNKS